MSSAWMKHVRQFDAMSIRTVVSRPAFGPHGRKVIAGLCGWELAALIPGSPVPTISQTVRSHPTFGWVLLALLGHHWFVEVEQFVGDVLESVEDAITSVSLGSD